MWMEPYAIMVGELTQRRPSHRIIPHVRCQTFPRSAAPSAAAADETTHT
jgi:hypothetical protein